MTEERRKHQLSRDEIEDIVSSCVRQVFEEERTSFFIEPEKHYQHHQLMAQCMSGRDRWRKNHEFVEEIQGNLAKVKSAGFITAFLSILGFIGAALVFYVKHGIQK